MNPARNCMACTSPVPLHMGSLWAPGRRHPAQATVMVRCQAPSRSLPQAGREGCQAPGKGSALPTWQERTWQSKAGWEASVWGGS